METHDHVMLTPRTNKIGGTPGLIGGGAESHYFS